LERGAVQVTRNDHATGGKEEIRIKHQKLGGI